jgi:hypothetical protein
MILALCASPLIASLFLCQITGNDVDLLNDKEKRKKEVEDKLQVLNAKKHNLVLVLKQVNRWFSLMLLYVCSCI